SAGGLAALGELLASLPADFPAAVVIAQHRLGVPSRRFEDLLGRRTVLAVKPAEHGDRLREGTVYVAPPDEHLLIDATGRLSLSHAAKVHFSRPSADTLFESAAEGLGP